MSTARYWIMNLISFKKNLSFRNMKDGIMLSFSPIVDTSIQ